jgi:hypothetical protein
MLKIKDNVDLKELEKFGFYKPKKGVYKDYVLLTNNGPRDSSHLSICDYDGKQRNIKLIQYAYDYKLGIDTIYDLIQANLVEKVEE